MRSSEFGIPLDAVFGALADPTRRTMIRRLADSGPGTATELARDLPISRQAVVKHLQALDAAGLVQAERVGREVRFAATLDTLDDASAWMADVGAAWDRRLSRLRRRTR
ncbi:MAG TPA: metalloregulator ArsR/SmtB family transcription factor [Microthrixaceae bacterium]|nr:metalloregulator ArsR/SmtB family transcription factor [Microthrixaceae bacterium]